MTRYHIALVSYWALFIIIPTALICYFTREPASAPVLFYVFVLVGEHLFRVWKKWLKVDGF